MSWSIRATEHLHCFHVMIVFHYTELKSRPLLCKSNIGGGKLSVEK